MRARRSFGEAAAKLPTASCATLDSPQSCPAVTAPWSRWRSLSTYPSLLLLFFVLTLPLVNPWVRGDGVGYYAYARALLIERDLHFEKDWLAANPTFRAGRVDEQGRLRANQYTSTGHLDNHFTIGPAILWAPFLVPVHLTVVGLDRLGVHIPADGYSRPYRVAMALATATYAFAGLCLAFSLARKYFDERWAFLATVGIWFGSSLPVYMYFNPSWSHAHSVFGVALFLWYWHRTRGQRTLRQWVLLGALSGLMINIYYPNGFLLVVPLLEAFADYWRAWPAGRAAVLRLLAAHLLFMVVFLFALLPTLVTRHIIYGSALQFGSGYTGPQAWLWTSPALRDVLFSSQHGLLSWTPILIPAIFGLFLLRRRDRGLAAYLLVAFALFYYAIASFYMWHGMSSFGNRFFVSLTPIFVVGLTASVAAFASLFAHPRRAFAVAGSLGLAFILWNAGLIFQWGTHLIPVRGPIVWREAAYNQFAVVPGKALQAAKSYLLARRALMGEIEREDIKQLREQTPEGH